MCVIFVLRTTIDGYARGIIHFFHSGLPGYRFCFLERNSYEKKEGYSAIVTTNPKGNDVEKYNQHRVCKIRIEKMFLSKGAKNARRSGELCPATFGAPVRMALYTQGSGNRYYR